MRCLDSLLKKWAFYLSGAAIGVVLLDLIILILECVHFVPAIAEDFLKRFTLVLVGATAILPAVVAALNGIRAQAECGRLAGRSSVMQLLLTGKEELRRYESDQAEKEKEKEEEEAKKKYTGVYRSLSELADKCRSREAAAENVQEAWSRDALLAVEAIACQMLEETVEWAVLYAKKVPD